jgi:hypothetical protein
VTSGLARRYNFNIVQQVDGKGILSTLPSTGVVIKGAKGAAGQDGSCPSGLNARVDFYIFGGTPPYAVASPLPGVASPSASAVPANGGSFTAQVNNCGKVGFIVTDATGRSVETAQIDAQQGDKGDSAVVPSLVVSPTQLSLSCNQQGEITLAGAGSFSTAITTVLNPGFSVTPSSGTLPGKITVARSNNGTLVAPSTISRVDITVNIAAGSLILPLIIDSANACP